MEVNAFKTSISPMSLTEGPRELQDSLSQNAQTVRANVSS